MVQKNARCTIQLKEPKRTNKELVSNINDELCQICSKFDLWVGGWNSKKQRDMKEWEIWDFDTGWLIGWRKKDGYITIFEYARDVIEAIVQGKIGRRVSL